MDDKFDSTHREMNLRFEAIQRNMTYWFNGLFSTLIASLIAVISLA